MSPVPQHSSGRPFLRLRKCPPKRVRVAGPSYCPHTDSESGRVLLFLTDSCYFLNDMNIFTGLILIALAGDRVTLGPVSVTVQRGSWQVVVYLAGI